MSSSSTLPPGARVEERAPARASSASVSERELLARATSGDADAFEELVRLHAGRIYALLARVVANRADAEEVTHETFVKAWRALPGFRGEACFSTWLFRIAMNEANRRLAFEARRSALPIDDVILDVPDLSDGPAGLVEATEVRDLLERAILELPPHYRIAVVLRDVEGLTNQEASEVLGLDLRNFKNRLHRGRMALRRRLEEFAVMERSPEPMRRARRAAELLLLSHGADSKPSRRGRTKR